MKMKDSTILRIKVPAHLYESVKAQLTLNEAKGKKNFGAGMEEVKGQKASGGASDKPKAAKNSAAPKAENREVRKDGHKKMAPAKKKMGLEELKALAELLNGQISELEEKDETMKGEGQIEEEKAPEGTEE